MVQRASTGTDGHALLIQQSDGDGNHPAFIPGAVACLITIIISLFFCGCGSTPAIPKRPVAQNGVLDLRSWKFDSDGWIDLNGEWHLYWDRLLTPEDFVAPRSPAADGCMVMQHPWSDQNVKGKPLPETGCATCRLLILLPRTTAPLSIETGRISTSFRLWTNGLLIAHAGVPGSTATAIRAKIVPQAASIAGCHDSLRLVLQMANFNYDRGGVTGMDKFGTISIGPTDSGYKRQLRQTRYEAFFVGAFIVMALFHFVLFFIGKNEKSLMYLGLICLLMLLYTIRDHLLMQYLPGLSWELYVRIINAPVFMLCGFFLLFFYSLYPEEAHARTIQFLTGGWVLFAVASMLLPQRFSFRVYSVFVFYMFILILYMIVIVVRAARHQRNSAKYIFLVSWIVAFSAVNDVLKGYGIVNTTYMVPYAGFFFILMCEIGIYERFVRAEQFAKKQQGILVETEKLASLGTLVAGVAHEINNPNNSILLSAQVHLELWKYILPIIDDYVNQNDGVLIGGMRWEQLRTDMPESLDRIIRNSRRIERIVTDLKVYARKDIGNVMEPVDINAVVRGCVTLLENKLKNSTDAFSVEYADSIPKIQGNFQKLEQVVINIIVNACQALPDRSRAIRIGTAFDSLLHRVSITITDEGCGIESQIVRHIFDPFFTTKQRNGGTGLGLSIAQSIIAGHYGELTVSSEVGVGTRITINLPVMEAYSDGNTK